MNETENTIFRTVLHQTVASQRFYKESINDELRKYDQLVDKGMSPENAFKIIHQASGADNTPEAVQTVKELIKSELESLNLSHPGIDRNPVSRIREIARRHNEKLKMMLDGLRIDGKTMPEAEKEKYLLKVPKCLQESTYTANASDKQTGEKRGEYGVTVRLYNNR